MAHDAAGAGATVRRIADFAAGLGFPDLSPAAVHASKRRIPDNLALRRHALPEFAAFANAAMARYLDGNDCFPGGGGHPSGVIAPVLAAAQVAGAGGAGAVGGRGGACQGPRAP